MGKEYKIKFKVPVSYNSGNLMKKLPNPVESKTVVEIYSFKVANDGFYFLDSLVDNNIASVAFKCLVDEALAQCDSVEIIEL